ncbi:DUF3046 domain-containing protein [Arthrobacter sp. JCM 19049]|uniref:DUF3046 domain-containing protein n=1 Tax=Arthrobacter sp. JCM 19049 TaxID=1460643 RepID=UPI0027957295|nr:DUF3046 domain-containing protein [Arthrobacter sp. JCM 19049]
MEHEFGPRYSRVLAGSLALTELGSLNASQALERGIDRKQCGKQSAAYRKCRRTVGWARTSKSRNKLPGVFEGRSFDFEHVFGYRCFRTHAQAQKNTKLLHTWRHRVQSVGAQSYCGEQ